MKVSCKIGSFIENKRGTRTAYTQIFIVKALKHVSRFPAIAREPYQNLEINEKLTAKKNACRAVAESTNSGFDLFV